MPVVKVSAANQGTAPATAFVPQGLLWRSAGTRMHHGAGHGKSQHGMGKGKRTGGDPAFANRNVKQLL
eukprot:COSAG02_NODE_56068_length_287_cov_0.829787_1_plen_68_part_00